MYVSPRNLEEEEAEALFRRNLDIIIALVQSDFRNLEEAETWFQWNLQNSEEAAALLRTSFEEPTAFFRRKLEEEEQEEVSFFWRNLDVVLVAFTGGGDIKIAALLGRNLCVEVCFNATLEVTSLFWAKLPKEALSRRNLGEAAVASALSKREFKIHPLFFARNSEPVWYARNLPAPPLSRGIVEADLFRMKLDAFIWRNLIVGNGVYPAYVLVSSLPYIF